MRVSSQFGSKLSSQNKEVTDDVHRACVLVCCLVTPRCELSDSSSLPQLPLFLPEYLIQRVYVCVCMVCVCVCVRVLYVARPMCQ